MKINIQIHLLLISFLICLTQFSHAQTLEIHVINVQQGTAILVQGPEKTLLFDGGKAKYATTHLIPYLEQLQIEKNRGIGYAVISHGDEDHYGGIKKLAKGDYDFELIYDNDGAKNYTGTERTICKNTSCQTISPMHVGDTLQLGDGAMAICVAVKGHIIDGSVVFIPDDKKYENDMSIVLLVKYKSFEFIAGGDLGGGQKAADKACTNRSTGQKDIESSVAQGLVNTGHIDAEKGIEVLHVNHHGSESSTNSNYMNTLSPKVAIISTGEGQGANYEHPRKNIVEKVLLAEADCITAAPALVLQTDQNTSEKPKASSMGYTVGDIVIKTSGEDSFSILGTGRVQYYGNNETIQAGIRGWKQIDMD